MTSERKSSNYFIPQGKFLLSENALGNPDLIQCSVSSDCTVTIVDSDNFALTELEEWPTFKLRVPDIRLMGGEGAYNIYLVVPVSTDVRSYASIGFTTHTLTLTGQNAEGQQVGDANYRFYLAGTVSAQGGNSSASTTPAGKGRLITMDLGTTPPVVNLPDEINDYTKVFDILKPDPYNSNSWFLRILAPITSMVARAISLGESGKERTVTSVATSADAGMEEGDDAQLATTGWVMAQFGALDEKYLRKDVEDTANEIITFAKGLKVGQFASGTSGASVFVDAETGQTVAEVDKLYVRMKAYFESLVISNVASIRGKQVISAGGGVTLSLVRTHEDDASIPSSVYRCYFLASQDETTTVQPYVVGDQLQSKDFNIAAPGSYTQVASHYYWRLVKAVSSTPVTINQLQYHYVDLSMTDADTGSDAPVSGDVVVQLGHRSDADRQTAQVFSSVDDFSPSITLYHGISGYSLVGKDVVSFGYDITSHQPFFNVYGSMYIGPRDGSSYIQYSPTDGVEIKARISASSSVGDQTLQEYTTGIAQSEAEKVSKEVKQSLTSLTTSLSTTSDAVQQIRDFSDTAFADGVVDRAERATVAAMLDSLATVKQDADASYQVVYNNDLLADTSNGVPRTNLANGYKAFCTAYDEYVAAINKAILDDVITDENRALVDQKYTNFNTKYSDFISYLHQANRYIQQQLNKAIGEVNDKYAYLSPALHQLTTVDGGLILSSVLSLGINNADLTTQTTYAGLSGLVKEDETHKGIAFWAGGDMVDIFDYYDPSNSKFVVPDGVRPAQALDRMDGTGYRAGGAFYWDKDGKIHVDPLTFYVGEEQVGNLLASFQLVMSGSEVSYIIPQHPFQSLSIASDLVVGESVKIGEAYLRYDKKTNSIYVMGEGGGKANFFAYGEVTAGGSTSTSTSGSSSASSLDALVDVDLINVANGDILVYNKEKTHWVNVAQSELKTDLSGYATESWVTNKGYLVSSDLDAVNTHMADATVHITSAERTKWNKVVSDFAAITGTDSDTIINKWEEVVAFLANYTEADTLASLLSGKVDKVDGKVLTSNDFTDTLLSKLNGIEAGANAYTHPTEITATTIAADSGKVLSAITVNTLGHVTAVSSKTLEATDIPALAISKITNLQDTLDKKLNIEDFQSMFELYEQGGTTYIRAKYNLFSDYDIIAGGISTASSGTTASGSLSALTDTIITNLANGDILVYDSEQTHWVNISQSELKTDLTGYATEAWVEAKGYITSYVNTTYSAGTGITLSGTTFSNSGVRSISSGSTNGTISVNTGGTSANVSVKGLGTAAYTASTAYAAASHTHSYAGSTSAGGAANSVANALALTIKSGTTEGTDLYTFDGSEAKTLNIVAGSNVTLTAAAGKLTIASTNTLTTAGSNQSTDKIFLVGAKSQASSATTYSNSSVYASAGYLYSGGTKVSVEGHTHTVADITDFPTTWDWSALTSVPTTVSGYGITDAYTKTEVDTKVAKYLPLTGGSITGTLSVAKLATLTGGATIPSSATLKIGDATISWDSSANALKIDKSVYSTSEITAGGSSDSTSSSTTTAGTLAALTDTTITSAADGDILVYDKSTTHWVNVAQSTLKTDLTGYATEAWVEAQGYITASGSITGNAATATTATKLGTATVGSSTKPIYLNAGTATAFSTTVGSSTKPIYLSSGTITAMSTTVGSSAKPVYMNAGTITAVTASSMFSVLTNSGNNISITIAGQNRTLTPAYATTAGSVANALALTIKSGTTEGTDLYTFNGSEAKSLNIVAGSNVTLTAAAGELTIASTNTTYSAGTGIALSGTTFSNSGVRSIATGATNGTISVNTAGTSAEVSVYGLGTAAYTDSTAYAAASHTHSYLPLSGGTVTGTIKSTYALALYGYVTSGWTYIRLQSGSTYYWDIATSSADSSNALQFRYKGSATSTNGMQLTTGGNLGIGCAAPTYKLQVAGTLYASDLATLTGGATIPSSASLKIGDATISWDSSANALIIDKSVYSTSEITAGGSSDSTSSSTTTAGTLAALTDTTITSAADGDILVYDKSTTHWVNVAQSTLKTDLTGYATEAWVEAQGYITSYVNTTYSAGTGISLSGTTFSNAGVRSISSGSTNGTISVNTGGTTANVSVKGLGTAAYTASTAYAAASHTHTVSSITDLGSIATKSADDYASGVTWDTVTTVGSWSRICKIDGYGNIILAIRFSQNSQASMNTYQVNTAYGYAVITQIGYNNYNANYAVQLRVTQSGSTHANFYVEVYNSYGYNSATTVTYTTRATILGPWCTFTPITTYTAGGDNVRSSLTSAMNYAANFVAQSAVNNLPLSGGTLSGTLTLKGQVYTDALNTGALNANNSNIYNVNQIQFGDLCDTANEGIQFYNTSTTVDSLWANSGVLYFTPNRTWGSTSATNYGILHTGNYGSYALPLSGGSITGDLLIPITKQTSTSYGVPVAGTMPQSAAFNDVANYKTFLGSFYHTTYSWYNIISIRHRNGASDGSSYGMRICGPMVSEGSLTYEQQIGGTWRSTRTLLDSKNYSSYALPITGGTVSGSITATGEITAGSDMRYKTPIAPITTIAPDKISKAPLFTFTWKNRDDTAIHLGSSAQYWQEIFPELVTGTDFLTLNYGALGTALGILNSRRIDTAEQRIAKLERENKKLKKEIKILKAERL